MKHKSVTVFAPATVSNIGCGFDVMGFAIEKPGDNVTLRFKKEPGIIIKKIIGDNGKLPLDVKKNTAGVAVSSLANHLQLKEGIEIILNKKMPLGSGLGSSAASAVAGVFALNELAGTKLSKKELLPFALEGEKIASGSLHADNVAPSLFGGFVLIRSYNPIDVIQIPTPDDLLCVVVHPHIELQTSIMRKMLNKNISLSDAITQWGNVGALVAGLMKTDYQLISRSIVDVVAEPVRSTFIPGYNKVKHASLSQGALGCSISGSGPSVFALTNSVPASKKIGAAMKKVFNQLNIKCDVYISPVNKKGPQIIT